MKKLLPLIAVLTVLFTSCYKSDPIVGGRYFGTFRIQNKTNESFVSGSLDLKQGFLIIESIRHIDTDFTVYPFVIHSTFKPDTFCSYTIPPFNDSTIILCSAEKVLLINDFMPLKISTDTGGLTTYGPDQITSTDSIINFLRTMPAIEYSKICDEGMVISKVDSITAEFKGGSVKTVFFFETMNESDSKNTTTVRVEFIGNNEYIPVETGR